MAESIEISTLEEYVNVINQGISNKTRLFRGQLQDLPLIPRLGRLQTRLERLTTAVGVEENETALFLEFKEEAFYLLTLSIRETVGSILH